MTGESASPKKQRGFVETGRRNAIFEGGKFSKLDPLAHPSADRSPAKWARHVALCERHLGLEGIKEDWRYRQSLRHVLPMEDTPDVKFLWATYTKHPELVSQVIDHASDLLENTGQVYEHLYELVMSYWLPRDTTHAFEYHKWMVKQLGLTTLPLKAVAHSGRSTFKPSAYAALMDIYRNSDECDIYDEVVPRIVKKGDIDMARQWHNLCHSRNDLPSEKVATNPVIQVFIAESATSTNELNSTASASQRLLQDLHKYNQELKQRLSGSDHAPVRFEDSFCARMFATKTFPSESIIRGLAAVGVNEIGPQALLAMASRTQPIEDLPKRFEELKAHGIALQGCVFSLALEKFALEHKWQLVRSMLDTDQHPDGFGDVDIQRRLLNFYLETGDHQQSQRTLAILALFHNDSTQETWNLLLRSHVRRSGPKHVMEVLQDMQTRGIMLSRKSILVLKDLLRRRQVGHKPDVTTHAKFDDLRFVTRVFMNILESGMAPVPPLTWREIIRRYGMTGRFKELRRLLLWLLCWYAPRSSMQFASLPSSAFLKPATERLRSIQSEDDHYVHFSTTVCQHEDERHPIRELFPHSFQQALIIWGFKAGLLPNATVEQSLLGPILGKKHYRHRLLQRKLLYRVDWSIGLETLVLLRDAGVDVHRRTVVKALQNQFTVMFGRGQSNKKENRIMEVVNTLPYVTYVREVNRIWGSPLFPEPEVFAKEMAQRHMWHPRIRRRAERETSIIISEILGQGWSHHGTEHREDVPNTTKKSEHIAPLKMIATQPRALEPSFGSLDGSSRGGQRDS